MLASQLEADDSWTVIKFGGAETVNCIKEISGVVQQAQSKVHVAVVCSALSTSDNAGGVSNRFARVAEEGLHSEIIKEIFEDHVTFAQQVIFSPGILADLRRELKSDCSDLELFLRALLTIKEISPYAKDVIIGTGAKLACRITTAAFLYQGYSAELVNLGSMCSPDNIHLFIRIRNTIESCTAAIPVTGFFGAAPLGSSVKCGHLGAAATLAAVSLEAKEFQICKEEDGFFATNLTRILTIHPTQADVPNPKVNDSFIKGIGTCIHMPASFPSSETLAGCRGNSSLCATAITIKENMSILSIHKSASHKLAGVFNILDLHNIVVDLIATSEVHISIVISSPSDLSSLMTELGGVDKVRHQMCIICLVGRRMRDGMGAVARISSALACAGIQVEMVSQASSDLSCVIHQSYSMLALAEIQKALL